MALRVSLAQRLAHPLLLSFSPTPFSAALAASSFAFLLSPFEYHDVLVTTSEALSQRPEVQVSWLDGSPTSSFESRYTKLAISTSSSS